MPNATDLNEAVAGLEFPASRDELVRQARGHSMDDQIIETLQHMPQRTYRSIEDVIQGLGDLQ